MSAINKPIRMCILCKERFEQNSLLRFQANNGKIVEFSHRGRSFYICKQCLLNDSMRLVKLLNSKLKMQNKKITEFGEYFSKIVQEHNKEICTNG
ncbi:MAG TPA: hypothetical protein CFH79_05760 [Sulfurospirillum sp. UBA11407]|jgi:predicted RNA-binding protein YlxR (DUF448 family)|nr:MAG TPA: hypothetical protein CFH79_05760 [Sulfurospirillum sp. UBA11407]DAB33365.1 MAG TPA: hypothetical protein CFH82_10870 [Sulfurospirillum sp. UBA12182]